MPDNSGKPPVLPYSPADPPPHRLHRLVRVFIHVLPWLLLWLPLFCGLTIALAVRMRSIGREPLSWGEVVVYLFLTWCVIGIGLAIARILR